MRKPNVIIIGCQKCGTSALRDYMNQHPDITILTREGHFFDYNSKPKIKNYYKWFSNIDTLIVGEKTPEYCFLSHVPKLIYKYLPDIKLIMLVRNPADRAYSEYWMDKLIGNNKYDFAYSIRYYPRSYLQRGMYAKQLKNILRYFKKKQILILKSEDLYFNRRETLKKVFRFLNVDEHVYIPNLKDIHIGASPKSKILTFISKRLNKIKSLGIDKYNGKGALLFYITTQFLQKFIKNANKQTGYPHMKEEDRQYIYDELKEDMKEFKKMVGISWD